MKNNFSYLKEHIGRKVRVDRSGPESQEGRLLGLTEDLLVLKNNDGVIFYYQTSHLKSITLDSKEELSLAEENWVSEGSTLRDVLEKLKHSWIQINRGGPEKVEGVLSRVEKDELILVRNEELIYISLFHIKSVSSPDVSNKNDQKASALGSSDLCEPMNVYTLSTPPSLRKRS
ncbi:spore coat protein [Guptibacillus hwajinpoensis]|uniref:spore coat protein n=1 Tax=Guptibacillus hwajinpoensis TaxID=208199 RepID=UPI003735416B